MKNKIIGVYQLITGIFGILLILLNIGKAFENKEIRFTIFLGLVLFFGLAFCGYALLKEQKNAVKYSIVAQAIQSLVLFIMVPSIFLQDLLFLQ
jgi:hypothetical protein